jgi:hypothetical protein
VLERPYYLTSDQLAERLGLKVRTLANWRSDPKQPGPRFRKYGNRIRYIITDVLDWEKRHEFGSTADYDGGAVQPTSPASSLSADPAEEHSTADHGNDLKAKLTGRRLKRLVRESRRRK